MVCLLDFRLEDKFSVSCEPSDDLKALPIFDGQKIDTSGLDLRFIRKYKRGVLSDFPFGLRGPNSCSAALRDAIEELEPGIHQFVPVDLFWKDGTPTGERVFLMNAGQKIESIDAENSQSLIPSINIDGNPYYQIQGIGGGNYHIVVKKEIVGKRHFWREGGLAGQVFGAKFFCSDALSDLIRSRKLKVRLVPLIVV